MGSVHGVLARMSAVLLSLSCGDQVVVRETEAACGNGSVEVGEQCDDGNDTNTDECTNGCEVGVCGDGVHARTSPSGMRV